MIWQRYPNADIRLTFQRPPRIAKLDLTVICGCLPAVRDFVHHLCPQLKPAQRDETKQPGGRSGRGAESPALFPPRPGWPARFLSCSSKFSEKLNSYNSTGALLTGRSGKSLVSTHDQAPMRSQCETDWSTIVAAVEEDPVKRMTRSVHQQATRDYHSHLYQNWWDQA